MLLLLLLETHLHNQAAKVVLDGQSSVTYDLIAEVPQGSPLGATMFLVFQ